MHLINPKNIVLFALSFLLIRNIPLAISFPIWTFGDEMAHMDYALKLLKGRIPQPRDHIEPELFRLNQEKRDIRFITDRYSPPPGDIEKLGFGGYSYAAKHPPLPYLIYDVFLVPASLAGVSLIAQVKILRIVTLFAMAAGICFLCVGIIRAGLTRIEYYSPLLFIALLPQDMYPTFRT